MTKYIPRPGRIELYTAAIVNDFKGRSKLQDQERKNLVAELERTNKRLQNARMMKVDGDLADDDFRILKTDCNNRIEELEKKLSQLSNKNSEINALLEQSLLKLSKLDVLYENGSVEDRRRIISSMFPENLHFDGKAYRTPRINEGVNLIYQKMKDLEDKKNETKPNFLALSRMVHPTRFELISSVPETEILSIELRVLVGLLPVTGCKYSFNFESQANGKVFV